MATTPGRFKALAAITLRNCGALVDARRLLRKVPRGVQKLEVYGGESGLGEGEAASHRRSLQALVSRDPDPSQPHQPPPPHPQSCTCYGCVLVCCMYGLVRVGIVNQTAYD